MSVPIVGGKKVPWRGWAALAPNTTSDRTKMFSKCGQKCFLGPKKSFPVCSLKSQRSQKSQCQIQQTGVWAAYIRAKEFSSSKKTKSKSKRNIYKRIVAKTRKLIKHMTK